MFGIEVHQLYYFEKDLKEDVLKINSPLNLKIRKAEKADIKKLLNLVSEDDKERIELSLKFKSICYIAWCENRVVGYTWLNTD